MFVLTTFPFQGAEWTADCHVIEGALHCQGSDWVPFQFQPVEVVGGGLGMGVWALVHMGVL